MMNGQGGGVVPRVQMPGGAPGGGMGAGMGGAAPAPQMGGGAPGMGGAPGGMPPGLNPNDPEQRKFLQRLDSMTEQEGEALLTAVMSSPLAAQAMRKLLPELAFILDMAGGGGPPGGAPDPMAGMTRGGAPGGMGGGMGGGGGMPPRPPGGSGSRLSSI